VTVNPATACSFAESSSATQVEWLWQCLQQWLWLWLCVRLRQWQWQCQCQCVCDTARLPVCGSGRVCGSGKLPGARSTVIVAQTKKKNRYGISNAQTCLKMTATLTFLNKYPIIIPILTALSLINHYLNFFSKNTPI
jgi:hypothetical protein